MDYHQRTNTLRKYTVQQIHELTHEPIDTLYKRIVRSGVVVSKNRHGEIEAPVIAYVPPNLAMRLLNAMVYVSVEEDN